MSARSYAPASTEQECDDLSEPVRVSDERKLAPAPHILLDASLTRHRCLERRVILQVPYAQRGMGLRVFRAPLSLVGREPLPDVVRLAAIEAIPLTNEEIDAESVPFCYSGHENTPEGGANAPKRKLCANGSKSPRKSTLYSLTAALLISLLPARPAKSISAPGSKEDLGRESVYLE